MRIDKDHILPTPGISFSYEEEVLKDGSEVETVVVEKNPSEKESTPDTQAALGQKGVATTVELTPSISDNELNNQERTLILRNEFASAALASEVELVLQPLTHDNLAIKWGIHSGTVNRIAKIYREAHLDEEFIVTKNKDSGRGIRDTYKYTPEQVAAMEEEANIIAPGDSFGMDDLMERWDRDRKATRSLIQSFRNMHPEEVIKSYRRGNGLKPEMRLTANQVQLLETERAKAPENYMNANDLSIRWNVVQGTAIKRIRAFQDRHPERELKNFKVIGAKGSAVHLSLDDVVMLEQELDIILAESPEGCKTTDQLASEWNLKPYTVRRAARIVRAANPNDTYYIIEKNNAGKGITGYTPLQQEHIRDSLGLDARLPEGNLKTVPELAAEWNVRVNLVYYWANKMVEQYPDQELKVYLPPEGTMREKMYLDEVQIALVEGFKKEAEEGRVGQELTQGEEGLREDLTNLLHDLSEGQSLESQYFQSLISLFGAERAVDILYQQRPEYKKLPVPYVKSALADYLGEFLLVKGGFSLDSLEKGAPFLAHASFKEGLTEVIKNDCLRLLNHLSRMTPDEVNASAAAEYIAHIRQETADFSTPELEEILGEVEAYYQLLFENIHKPDCFVDQLDNGRRFPDINQRINVQEIAFKHKMLIADDMGTGKSASAIMAKEIIGIKQALVVVPSNVVSIWQDYLSDKIGDDGSQIGYFKEGQEPRVLIVNSLEDLTNASPDDYDYIVISQERLNENYTDALTDFDYDMLIVDEMHKLKNVSSGKRSENLIKLAEYIEGEGKYLALLSGTPVPNKIGDIALTLKLLYPERFGDTDNKKLVSQILSGDMLDLRGLLVPRMQMKSLAENIDMPELYETTQLVELSDQEKEIYDILIEEDELSASEKLITLRQFAMNPRILDATPSIVGSKATQVGEALGATFLQKDKVVMFVNGYIEGVMRGEDTIIQDLSLPEDVEVLTIDGSVSKERRIEIQSELQAVNKKMLLIVSGQTADTGVDFSAAEAVYHYNEPWSIYDKQQQTARVYRPGLKSDLVVQTFVTEGTIEHGIHQYIDSKYHAVEKLLRGVPISEVEKGMLQQAEKEADPNIEVSPELAKYYFSSWDKMMKIYGHVKELGEEDFRKFLARYDKDYADSYADLAGSRSYQANVSRLSGSIIKEMVQEKKQEVQKVRILDMASGPEVLRRHAVEDLAPNVISIDINRQHFNGIGGKKAVGSR